MTTWKIISQLEKIPNKELIELKERALKYLRQESNRLDNLGCARHLGLGLGLFCELRNLFFEEFDEIEKEILFDIEKAVVHSALGIKDIHPTQLTNARWILERRTKRYQGTKAAQAKGKNNTIVVESNGKGAAILDEYEGS